MEITMLSDDAITDILIRLPPDEPSCLVRASLVCRSWRQLLSDPAFFRRYREFHRTPPMLGFFRNIYDGQPRVQFVPTATPSSFSPSAQGGLHLWGTDCRHGRVLFNSFVPRGRGVIIWDPVTGDQHFIPTPSYPACCCTSAVICGTDGCDHLDCHGGPFRVVFVEIYDDEGHQKDNRWWVSIYSSETGELSAPSTIQCDGYIEARPSVLSKDALHFSLDQGSRILKFDLIGRGLSVIDAPDVYKQPEGIVVTSEDGGLGLVGVQDDIMHLWSWQDGFDGVSGWVKSKVIKIKTLLPIPYSSDWFDVIGFAEGTNIIFMNMDDGVYAIMLKSGQAKKICEPSSSKVVLPYTSFYNSDLARCTLPLP